LDTDIVQLYYFINIVECGNNLSLSAKRLHITQSALSQMIKRFESVQNVTLFHRRNGRLEGLTESGQKFYEYARKIVETRESMVKMIRNEAAKQKGTIRVGVPSLILRVYFTDFFAGFIFENPDFNIQFEEAGCIELRKKLINNDLDYAILIEPVDLNPKDYEVTTIFKDEMTAFMSERHLLSKQQKLAWAMLENQAICTFNESFFTYHLVSDALKENEFEDQIVLTSSSWDFLIELSQKSDIIAILPSPIRKYLQAEHYIEKHFMNPIPFNVLLCRPHKNFYSQPESILHKEILTYFTKDEKSVIGS
jgi:DNA-binding transcriptional LysR family regulator